MMAAKSVHTRSRQMPEIDPRALARQRGALVAERSAQLTLAGEHEATFVALTGQGDVDSILERELAGASAARVREAVEDIDAALDRMDEGSYGVCEACGAAIPIERLEAIPRARTCVACPAERGGFLS